MSLDTVWQERPIIFSAPMVRAVVGGRKTQTRRVVKSSYRIEELSTNEAFRRMSPYPLADDVGGLYHYVRTNCGTVIGLPCPYGKPRDRLWVREAWRTEVNAYDDLSPSALSGEETIIYEADADWSANHTVGRLRPSIHMPRWASRLQLEIADVRLERLQDISETDAEAEGVDVIKAKVPTNRDAYRYLWDDLNSGRGHGWDVNPWVWVVQFWSPCQLLEDA